MENGLVKSLLLAGMITLVGSGLVSCGNLIKPREYVNGNIHGVKYEKKDQSIAPYKVEEQNLNGQRTFFKGTNSLYIQDGTNKIKLTLPFTEVLYEDVIRSINVNSRRVNFESKKEYVPTLVDITNKYGKRERWANQVNLATKGLYGLKAKMMSLEEAKKNAGISGQDYGYKIVTTEDGAAFGILTIKIDGKEYFFPEVSDDKTNEIGKLNYYLIPTEGIPGSDGAFIKIDDKCGNISISNTKQIFRPIERKLLEKMLNKLPAQTNCITNKVIDRSKEIRYSPGKEKN